MSAPDRTVPGAAASGGLEMTTRRTITATAEDRTGMTLDELASFLRQAMAAGLDPATPVRVDANRKGVVASVSVEGTARQ